MHTSPSTFPSKVVIVEDHPTIAVLLGQYINACEGFTLTGWFGNGDEALAHLRVEPADLVIVDLGLPGRGGLEVIADIRAEWPDTKVLVFSALSNPLVVSETMRLGVHGFVEKTAPFEQLGDALRNVMRGQIVLGPEAGMTLREIVRHSSRRSQLDTRDLTMLRMLREGRQVKEIAVEVGISVPGAYKAIGRLRDLLGAKSITDLAVVAVTSLSHDRTT
ncbi:MAG: response regulator [Cephaloticoccus sp.]